MKRNCLKKYRKLLKFSQVKLAEAARCSRATIILVERHNYYPGSGVRSRLATALFVSEAAIWPDVVGVSDAK